MTGMRDKPLRRFGLLVLPLLILLNIVTLPVHAAAEQNDYSDAVWRNGKYSSSLGDMAGRQLYVYGIVDSSAEVGENGTDLDIKKKRGRSSMNTMKSWASPRRRPRPCAQAPCSASMFRQPTRKTTMKTGSQAVEA